MGQAPLRVILIDDAWADLNELSEYWIARGEAWRAEKYSRDLIRVAEEELSDRVRAGRGRRLKSRRHPDAREILAFGIYRVIYEIDEAASTVKVLRFWHSHRDTPPLD
ncbi:MAG TPA: type II toxin-antitoxin system RelE/ParE family toxin [Chthoniobacteraceae bacterium]|nr:type II toxin-antitoxin system RelE/ParE family toxin [Chthoniobacteraceae bacterium]